MRKIYLCLCALFAFGAASAQLSVGLNANYTMYKSSFRQSTPGLQFRVGYGFNERSTGVLGFNYAFPIKEASVVNIADDNGNDIDVASEIQYKFKTISFTGQYSLIGDNETTGKFYGLAGAGLVLVSYAEKITGDYDKNRYNNPTDLIEKTSENGFTINLGVGGEYQLGLPRLFAEAAIAIPANQVNNAYVQNVIPVHFMFNLGIKLNLGASE